MKSQFFSHIVAACIALSTLSACQQQRISSEAAEDGRKTISFAVRDYQRNIYERFAETFMSENPDTRVVIVSSDDLTEQLLAQDSKPTNLARSRWTLSNADTTFASDLTEMSTYRLITDLKPLMEADPGFDSADFYPGMLEQGTVNNHI